MAFHNLIDNIAISAVTPLGGTALVIGGAGSAEVFVQLSGYEYAVGKLTVGTVTGASGSVVSLQMLEATSTAGAGSALISGASLTTFANGTVAGSYAVEIKNDVLTGTNGTTFVGVRVNVNGTLYGNLELIRHAPRQAPTANGLAGSAFVVA
jgi:hypothetical protein